MAACRVFSWDMRTDSCGLRDLVPRQRIESRPPALGEQGLSHWTTREVPFPMSFLWQPSVLYRDLLLPDNPCKQSSFCLAKAALASGSLTALLLFLTFYPSSPCSCTSGLKIALHLDELGWDEADQLMPMPIISWQSCISHQKHPPMVGVRDTLGRAKCLLCSAVSDSLQLNVL